MLAAAWITAVATGLLAVLAAVTALYARRAFREQSREVRAIERQAKDQAEMLRVQSDQLDAQHDQLESLRKVNEKQIEVLGLQATDLRESLDERNRDSEERRRAQASRVFIWQEYREGNPALSEGPPPDYMKRFKDPGRGQSLPVIVAHVENASDQPIYDLTVKWTARDAFQKESRRPKPLMPHEKEIQPEEMPAKIDPRVLSVVAILVVAIFRDAAGVYWEAHSDGTFDEIPEGEVPVT